MVWIGARQSTPTVQTERLRLTTMKCKQISIIAVSFLLLVHLGVSWNNTAAYPGAENQALAKNHISAPTLATIADWFFESDQEGAELGFSVHSAGDVNGDGFDDIVIGSPLYTIPSPENIYREGAAFVFWGHPGGFGATPDWIAGSGKQGARYGTSVSTAGDVNGDGYDDIIVGAEDFKLPFPGNTGEPKSGAAFLYLGSADGPSETADWIQYAVAPEISFGFSVASAGDVNGDGFDDILVGAPNYESQPEQANEGIVYLYLGSEDGPAEDPDWMFECDIANSSCGYAVSGAGDVNYDGYADVIIGAPHYDNPNTNAGAALLFYGSQEGLGSTANQILLTGQEGAWFGETVSSAGDINGDGYSDIVIGASRFDKDENNPELGAAFIYLGSPTGPGSNFDGVLYGPEADSRFGRSVHSAGDINQDGYADIIVGAYLFGQNGGENQPDEGAIFLFAGGATGLDSTPYWSAYGNKADAWFGFSVSSAGDNNGDGGVDIIVGAPNFRFDDKTIMGRAFAFLYPFEDSFFQAFIPIILTSK